MTDTESPAQLVAVLAKELDLSAAQRQQIENTLNTARDTVHVLRDDLEMVLSH